MSSASPSKAEIESFIKAGADGELAVVQQLLGKYAKRIIDCKDSDGRTAVRRAALSGHTEVVRLLISSQADLNIQDNVSTVLCCVYAYSSRGEG